MRNYLYIYSGMKNPQFDTGIRDRFVTLWQKYCRGDELPLTFEICVGGGQQRAREIPDGWQYVQKLNCYLNTHDEKKHPPVQHWGFQVIEQLVLPDSVFVHTAMQRNPR